MKIGIVGCGMGGMASAIALARQGHDVSVFEAFARPGPVGAGLLLQPTGLKALADLDLLEQISARGAAIDGLRGCRPDGRLIMDLQYRYGRRDDIGIGIHRATLFDTLFNAMQAEGVTLHTGMAVTNVQNLDRPSLEFVNGNTTAIFDTVIVSDGAHSTLRHLVCADARAPQYPWGAVWSIRPDPDRIWHDKRLLAQIYSGTRIMVGILPVGENPAEPDGPDCVSFFWSLETDAVEQWRAAGLDAFRQKIAGFWPDAVPLLENVKSLDEFAPAAYRDVRCRKWSNGKLILIGDAAHGASPQLGQGANMAICDALALAEGLKDHAPIKAFIKYEKNRRPTLRYYTWMSWALTPVFQGHTDWIGHIRDMFFGLMCRLPGMRNLMAWTLVGRGRWFW
jgi:2-polyprenyl-6-methoxyphenol hydroxylase-like FAD-dependent oxidoreductase